MHPDVFIPQETSFIVPMAYVIDRVTSAKAGKEIIKNIILSSDDFPVVLKPYVSEKEVQEALSGADYTLSGMVRSIYERISVNANKTCCGDKSPNDLISIQIFQNLGLFDSDIKIIHIVRDVRGVMASLQKVNWKPAKMEFTFPRLWSYTNLHLHHLMKESERYLFIRYEDMVADPEQSIKSVTTFLGIKFHPGMLEEKERGLTLRHMSHHANLALPYLRSRGDAWKHELEETARNICETTALEGLTTFRYKLER